MKKTNKRLNTLVPQTARSIVVSAERSISAICFCILGLLNNKQELPAPYVVKTYNQHFTRGKARKINQYQANKAFQFLLDNEVIEIERTYSHQDRIPYRYRFTELYIQLRADSTRFYRTYRDMYKRQNAVEINSQSVSPMISTFETTHSDIYLHEWTSLSTNITPESAFYTNMSKITNNQIRFDFQHALKFSKDNSISMFPTYLPPGNINICYTPTVTGRLTPNPYIYFNKEYRRFLLPAEDVDLKSGSMFSLDFNAQELRILGHYCNDGALKQICNKNLVWTDIITKIDVSQLDNRIPPDDYKSIAKDLIYGILYGSKGDGPVKNIAKKLNKRSIYLKYKRIEPFVKNSIKTVHEIFPEIINYRNKLIYDHNSSPDSFRLPGGLVFQRGYTTPKNGGKSRRKPLDTTLLNHHIQSTGSLILRNIIADSEQLKHSRILYPVHDSCVFYVPNKNNHLTAIDESRELMETCAQQVVPTVIMPAEIEWERVGG